MEKALEVGFGLLNSLRMKLHYREKDPNGLYCKKGGLDGAAHFLLRLQDRARFGRIEIVSL